MSEKKTFAEKAKEYPFLVPGILSAWLLWFVTCLFVSGYLGKKAYYGLLNVPIELYTMDFHQTLIDGGYKLILLFNIWRGSTLIGFAISCASFIMIIASTYIIFKNIHRVKNKIKVILIPFIILPLIPMILATFIFPVSAVQERFKEEYVQNFIITAIPILTRQSPNEGASPYICLSIKQGRIQTSGIPLIASDKFISLMVPQKKGTPPKIVTYPQAEVLKMATCYPSWVKGIPPP